MSSGKPAGFTPWRQGGFVLRLATVTVRHPPALLANELTKRLQPSVFSYTRDLQDGRRIGLTRRVTQTAIATPDIAVQHTHGPDCVVRKSSWLVGQRPLETGY